MPPTPHQSAQASHLLPESTGKLAKTPLWQTRPEFLSIEERVELSYKRAQSVVQHYRKIFTTCLHEDLTNLAQS